MLGTILSFSYVVYIARIYFWLLWDYILIEGADNK